MKEQYQAYLPPHMSSVEVSDLPLGGGDRALDWIMSVHEFWETNKASKAHKNGCELILCLVARAKSKIMAPTAGLCKSNKSCDKTFPANPGEQI